RIGSVLIPVVGRGPAGHQPVLSGSIERVRECTGKRAVVSVCLCVWHESSRWTRDAVHLFCCPGEFHFRYCCAKRFHGSHFSSSTGNNGKVGATGEWSSRSTGNRSDLCCVERPAYFTAGLYRPRYQSPGDT